MEALGPQPSLVEVVMSGRLCHSWRYVVRGEIDTLLCFRSSSPLPDLLRCSEAGRGGMSSSFSADSHRVFLRKTLKRWSELMTRATPEISGRLEELIFRTFMVWM